MSNATSGFETMLGACVAVNNHPLSGENVSVWVDSPNNTDQATQMWGRVPYTDE